MFTITGLMMGREEKGNFMGFSGENLRKHWLILQSMCRNFRSKLHQKTVVKKPLILWELSGQISFEMDQFCISAFFNIFLNRDHYFLFQQQYMHSRNSKAFNITASAQFFCNNHNLCPVVLGRCFLVEVGNFQDKFAHLH